MAGLPAPPGAHHAPSTAIRGRTHEQTFARSPDEKTSTSDGERRSSAANVESLRFGVFRRMRSVSGADVFPRGLPTRGAKPVEQVPLAEALTRRWDDDRHIVLYTSDRPYRINNAAVRKARVEVRLVAFDVDNHDDAPGWLEAERAKIAALVAAHPGGFAHTTRRGYRVLYALPAPMRIASEADKSAFVLLYARIAAYVFARFGIALDAALIRWNQPIRLPHVVRDGRIFDAEILAGDPSALGAFALPDDVPAGAPDLRALARVVPSWGGVAKQWQPQRERLRVVSSAWDRIPLPPYPDRIAAAARWAREEAPRAVQGQGGRATARSVAAMLHVGFALERDDVERLLVGPYNHRRCSPPWREHELDDLRAIAHAVARSPIHTPGFLLSRDRTGLEAARATLAAAAEAQHPVPLAHVPTRLVEAVEQHRAVVVRASYGAGKTYAMSRTIARATTGRVLVVVPRHELGRAWVDALAAAGETDVAYHASVVQRRDAAGRRICDNKVALRLYERGGDVRRDACPSCPRAAECPAYAERPNGRARVHVLPREMLPKMGVTDEDLVVFDDAAVDLVAWHRLTVRQLQRLAGSDPRLLPAHQRAYVTAFVAALLAGPRRADAIARDALGDTEVAAKTGAALRQLAARAVEGQRSPYVASEVLAEGGDELAATLRDAGTIRAVLRFAEACAVGAEVQWGTTVRSVHGDTAAARVLRAHQGRLVVLDAAANVEELTALRSDLTVVRLDVPDAGDAERTLLFVPNAHRKALGDACARAALLDAWLDAALARLTARGVRRAVLVTYKALVPELRAHPRVVAWLGAMRGRSLRFAHYGAVRGSNRFARTQAVVTLGDPWLNGDDVLGRAAWLELPDEPAYRIALARAELGQAHGRSRSVRRRRRLTHVHVGRLVPEGWAAGVDVAPLGGPPERGDGGELDALVRAVGGKRVAAEVIGCSPSAVSDWRRGRRAVPRAAVAALRDAVDATKTSSVSSGQAARARPSGGVDAGLCKQRLKGPRVHPLGAPSEGEDERGVSEEPVEAGPAARPSLEPQNANPSGEHESGCVGSIDASVRLTHREPVVPSEPALSHRHEAAQARASALPAGQGVSANRGAPWGARAPARASPRDAPASPADAQRFAAHVLALLDALGAGAGPPHARARSG